MYVIPGYIKKNDNKNHFLLENEINGKTVEIENKYLEEYNNIYDRGLNVLNTKLTQFLHDEQFLLTKEEIRYAIESYYAPMDRMLHIVIMVTEQCNFRCKYCYEEFKVGKMEEEDLKIIVNFIDNQLNNKNFEVLHVAWFGGEPTLEKNMINKYGTIIQKVAEKYNVCYCSSMTTNGYLLSSSDFEKFLSIGITTYQITLDGFVHDNLRVLSTGAKTMNTIINNLKEIKNNNIDEFQIIIRHNILNEDKDLLWYDYLKGLFGNDNRFLIDVHKISNYSDNASGLNLILDSSDEILEFHRSYIKKIGLQLMERKDSISKLCYALYPYNYTFRPNKKIVKCTVELENENNRIGEIKGNKIVLDKAKITSIVNRIPYDECYTCKRFSDCKIRVCPRNKMSYKECKIKL